MSRKGKVRADDAKAPLGILRFLYMGSADVKKELEYYTKALGVKKVWDFTSIGTRVAAVQVSSGPLLLLATAQPLPFSPCSKLGT
jgi:hypothetical protein